MTDEKILTKTLGMPRGKQPLFHTADTRYVAYGGAKGGGKSHAVRQKATYLSFKYPGIKILIIRRTLRELEENHTQKLLIAYGKFPPHMRPKYRDQKKTFTFPNGSTITLGYCANENDVLQYQGQDFDVVFLDEATRLSEFQFRRIDETVRGVNDFPKRMYLTCNPGGVGHAWVKRLFIDRDFRTNEIPDDYTFIQAKLYDNEAMFEKDKGAQQALKKYMEEHELREPTPDAIMHAWQFADYMKTLKKNTLEEQRAYLDGDWNVFSGVYFGEFDEVSNTCEPFPIPHNWRKSVAIDYGLDALAVLWIAMNENGFAYVYREHKEPNLQISAAAKRITELSENDVIDQYLAPPDLWNRRQETGKSAYDIFVENGIPLIKAGNDRVHGWLNVKEWIKMRNFGTEEKPDRKPYLLVFRTCTELIDNIKKLQHDEKKKDDVAIQPHDITHVPDALRYWCSLRQLNAPMEMEPVVYQFKSEMPEETEGFIEGEVTEEYLIGGY